jgi:hypothetical protein
MLQGSKSDLHYQNELVDRNAILLSGFCRPIYTAYPTACSNTSMGGDIVLRARDLPTFLSSYSLPTTLRLKATKTSTTIFPSCVDSMWEGYKSTGGRLFACYYKGRGLAEAT